MPEDNAGASPAHGTGIRVIPPLVFITALALGYGLERLWPIIDDPGAWAEIAAAVLILASLSLVIPMIIRFRKAATPIDVRKPATALVTEGPFRFSRNPAYVSLILLYVGIGLWLASVWILVMVIPAVAVLTVAVIKKEEQHLEARFGEQYRSYRARVRRWL